MGKDLGFTAEDRTENVRRVAEVSKLFAEAGAIVVAGLISPFAKDRAFAREAHLNASLPFLEVFVDAPLSVVQERDTKGLYEKAKKGIVKGLTGYDAPYEAPTNPEIHIQTDKHSVEDGVNIILDKLDEFGIHLQRKFRKIDDREECDAR